MAGSVSKEALLKILGNNRDALAKLEEVDLKAEELKKSNPTLTVQIDAARARAEMALLKVELKRELGSVDVKVKPDVSGFRLLIDKGLGGLSGMLTSAGGGLGGIPGLGGLGSAAESNPYVAAASIAGVTVAASALLVEVTGLVSGFVAAGAGLGAFGLLALPTLDKIKNAYTNIGTAQLAYNTAVEKEKIAPTKANATAVATALTNLKVAQDQAGPAATTAIGNIGKLKTAFENMATAFQPTALKVFNDALKVANTLLPDLKPFADSAGGAIDGLLGKVNTFFQSADFKKWLGQFQALVGPALTAIGDGLGQTLIAVGKLFTKLSAKDDVNAINIAFGSIKGAIDAVTFAVGGIARAWDASEKPILGALGVILNAEVLAFGWIPGIGPLLKTVQGQFAAFSGALEGDLGGIQAAADKTWAKVAAIGKLAAGLQLPVVNPAQTGKVASLSRASGGYAGGLTLVGERGPELLNLPGGSYVFNAQKTKTMLAAGSGGGGTVRVQLEFAGGDGPIIEAFKRAIRLRGGGGPGSVQVALGQG